MQLANDANAEQPTISRRSEVVLLLTLAAVQFTSIVDFMVIMPLGPKLMAALGISLAQFGLVVSSYGFAAGAAGLIASVFVDRFSRRRAFLTLYSGFLLGTLFCALAPNYWTLVAARVVTGAFGGVLGGIAMAIIGDVFPEERRGRATAVLMTAFALASVAGVPAGLALGQAYQWHVPFFALVVLGLPVLALGRFTIPPLTEHIGRDTRRPWPVLRETLTHPNHLKAFALTVALMFGSFALIPYITAFLQYNVGMPDATVPWIYSIAGGLTLFTAPLVGRFADRYGKLRAYRIIAPISAVIMLSLAWVPRGGEILGVALVAALMVTNAGRMVAAMSMVTSSVDRQRRGSFMSVNSSIQHIASGLGAIVGGQIIVKLADNSLRNLSLVGLLAAASTLVSLWLAGRLQTAEQFGASSLSSNLAAAAEANYDVGEPLADEADLATAKRN